MSNITSLPSSQDERVNAALAHVTILIPFFGFIAPFVTWLTQKEKSRYVAFHGLQALVYQLSMMTAWFMGLGCYVCSFCSTYLILPFASPSGTTQSVNPLIFVGLLIPFLVFGVVFIGSFACVIYGIVGAIMTFQGKPFRYFFIGNLVERLMQQKENVVDKSR
jgi:uncharacterized Tic20 family protein